MGSHKRIILLTRTSFTACAFILVVATSVLTWHTVFVVVVQTVLTPSEHVSLAAHAVQFPWLGFSVYVPLAHGLHTPVLLGVSW